MKVLICFPPLNSEKGCPTLGQNRQFQYFKSPTYIYPVVPACAATLLKEDGFEVRWLDCIAENISHQQFLRMVEKEKPDLIALETKTPVIKQEWRIVNNLKALASGGWRLRTLLFGDHVTALPKESLENSEADFILTGGDYDYLLLNLCRFLRDSQPKAKDQRLTTKLEGGIWYRENGSIKNTGKFQLQQSLDDLPFIDRKLTRWQLYAYDNGNYRSTPGTYIMSGRDCWWGRCRFCSWTQLYTRFRVRKTDNVLDEIEFLAEKYKVREIMDDTGTFPAGDWLWDFCRGMTARGLNRRVKLDCNMRFGAVDYEGYRLMRKAGFRFLLFGLESANQKTLDRINKALKVETIVRSCQEARRAGLYPHITIMLGYPWESYEDARKTLALGKWLLKKDYAYTMQATIVIPYPGTPLFEECREQDLLYSYDWDDYDMKNPVMKLDFPPEQLLKLVQKIYSVSFSPEFILRKLVSIRELDDVRYFGRAFRKVLGHITDFKNPRRQAWRSRPQSMTDKLLQRKN